MYSRCIWGECTHICGHELLSIIDAEHSDLTLADERVVIRIGGYQQHLWNQIVLICLCSSYWKCERAALVYKWEQIHTSLKYIYRLGQASCLTWSDRRCGSSSLPAAETSLWIFPEGLIININMSRDKIYISTLWEAEEYKWHWFMKTYTFQYQLMPTSPLFQSGCGWIFPGKVFQLLFKFVRRERLLSLIVSLLDWLTNL